MGIASLMWRSRLTYTVATNERAEQLSQCSVCVRTFVYERQTKDMYILCASVNSSYVYVHAFVYVCSKCRSMCM